MSNIRVFVQWSEATVFAGEDIECQITFRNIAAPAASRIALHPNAAHSQQERTRRTTGGKSSTGHIAQQAPRNRGHRTTLSLNVPISSSHQSSRTSPKDGPPISAGNIGSHKRSVSIISITSNEAGGDGKSGSGPSGERPRRVSKGHGRSASLQVTSKHGNNGAMASAPTYHRSPTHPGPSFSNATSPRSPHGLQNGAATVSSNVSGAFAKSKSPNPFPHNFKFPATPSTPIVKRSGEPGVEGGVLLSPSIREAVPDQTIPTARVLSPASIAGTPRSSGEFYSLSNNSTETLASEYQPQQSVRGPNFNGHVRRPSNLAPSSYTKPPESLMMGYAQIHGSFTLDPALINQSSFDDVKRKGAIGGQGGGVVGVETKKRDSGLLRGFGWSNLGESFGGLLNSGELSSMKDMRDIASSRSIPLLSTPQSILFVDLRLAPGESKSYSYKFKLPRGLPPSHRGKAIKIAYKLIVGTQRPGGAKEQQVKSVEIPFRVLGGVNSHGELLGHDLMSPYILLRDQAQVHTTPDATSEAVVKLDQNASIDSTLDHFLAYTEELLSKPRQNSSLGLLSPLEATRSRRQSHVEEPTTAREAIDMAILRSNTATESQQSANRFEIARSGQRVAVIMLARPSYRLGETVTAIIDFTDADIPSYAVHASLESSENIQASISLRSEASILRVTRKTYVSHSESTLFSRRVVFSPTIPTSATPAFFTSGVNLEWRVRVEFVTPQLGGSAEGERKYPDRLEEVGRDDRGVILAAAESIDCESFEVSVPLRVYGALGGSTEVDASVEGMVV